MEFHENPFNGIRDIAEDVLCTASKVPFMNDDLDQNYRCCRPLGLSARYGVS